MEEAELRLAEIRKSHYEFDRDIVKGSFNAQTNKVVAEKVTRYFEDKIRARVSPNPYYSLVKIVLLMKLQS